MEIKTLQELLLLAEKRNFTATADSLYISTSSLSRHVMALEKELGVPLLHRNSRNVNMTRYGEILLRYAKKIVALESELLEDIGRTARAENGALCIGAFREALPTDVISRIAQFVAKNREISLALRNDGNACLIEKLREGEYDMVFVQEEEPATDDEFSRISVAVDSLAVALPKSHVLAGANSLRLAQLRDATFLLPMQQSVLYSVSIKAFERAGYEPKQEPIGVTGVGQMELVEQGFGVAIVQKESAQAQCPPGVKIIPVDQQELVWINLVWKTGCLSKEGRFFVQHFKDTRRQCDE